MRLTSRRRLGGALWAAGVVLAVGWGMLRQPDSAEGMVGIGHGEIVQVASLEEGRLAALDVGLHDTVSPGQVVAKIDPTPLTQFREVLAAELLSLAGPSTADLNDELKQARNQAKRLETRAELAAVEAQIERLERLLDQGAASAAEVEKLQSKRARLLADLARDGMRPDAEGPNAWNVVAAAKRLDALDARIEALQLRSALGGRVSAVLRHPGEVVRRGEPVLEVREAQTDEVLAWAPSGVAIVEGAAMIVVRADGTELSGAVVSVGSGPTLVPERVWRDPRREEWGVAVRVRLADGVHVLPEEPVLVRL